MTEHPDIDIYRWPEDPYHGEKKVVLGTRERTLLPNGKWFRKFRFWIKISKWFELNIDHGVNRNVAVPTDRCISVPNESLHPLRCKNGSGGHRLRTQIEPMVRGFLLDLGIAPSPYRGTLAESWGDEGILKMPRFVPDDRFRSRYQEAEEFTLPKLDNEPPFNPAFLEYIHNFQIQAPAPGYAPNWKVKWSRTSAIYRYSSREECVNAAIEAHLILPESRREEWMGMNVVRGAFIIPSPEEVEMLRILDEPIPFLLPQDELTEWHRARGLWPPERE